MNLSYPTGSYSDIASKFTVYKFPEPEDMVIERYKALLEEIDYLLEDYDSDHLTTCYMDLKKSMAMYLFFATEEYDFE